MSDQPTGGVIYRTTNLETGDTYIGQTARKYSSCYLGSGAILKRDIEKYGKECFSKDILLICRDGDQLDRMERLFIALLAPEYNIMPGGRRGFKYPEEIKNLKKCPSPELRKKISDGTKIGQRKHPESMERQRAAMVNRVFSKEHRIKLSNSETGSKNHQWGKKTSDETKEKIRTAMMGRVDSDETRKKKSIAAKKRHETEKLFGRRSQK